MSIEASRPRDELAIALAGPLVSLGVALASLPVALIAGTIGGAAAGIAGGVMVVGGLNLLVAALSLLPGMPLDGGRAVRALAWARSGDRLQAATITARVSGASRAGPPSRIGVALALADMITGGLLVLCLGWLLTTGGKTLDKRLRLERLLQGASVSDATRSEVPRIDPALTVDTFAARLEGDGRLHLPAGDGGRHAAGRHRRAPAAAPRPPQVRGHPGRRRDGVAAGGARSSIPARTCGPPSR